MSSSSPRPTAASRSRRHVHAVPARVAHDGHRPEQSGATFTVPGIVLGVDVITMRTEGVLVDAVLGPGDGLDAYSKALQEVALAERRVAVAERQAEVDRLKLARKS